MVHICRKDCILYCWRGEVDFGFGMKEGQEESCIPRAVGPYYRLHGVVSFGFLLNPATGKDVDFVAAFRGSELDHVRTFLDPENYYGMMALSRLQPVHRAALPEFLASNCHNAYLWTNFARV